MEIKKLLYQIEIETRKAMIKYKPFNSTHEGYAVILEELDELWDHVKKNKGYSLTPGMEHECIQVAAMAIRFVLDLK